MKGVSAIRRTELKFLLSSASAEIVRSRLSAVFPFDFFARENGAYQIRSLYFDDRSRSAYFDKLAGISERRKYRIRYYNGDRGFIRLEEKDKFGDLSEKYGVRISEAEAASLSHCQGGTGPFSAPLLEDFSRKIRTGVLSPALFVDYERTAFCHPAGDLRVTLDRRVKAAPFRGNLFDKTAGLPVLFDREVILEIKFNGVLPTVFRSLIEDIPKTQCSVSKFTLCCSALF